MKVFTSEWIPKPCDICDSSDIRVVGTRKYSWPTRNGLFKFELNDSVCNKCLYPFVSRIPTQEFLDSFYENAFYNGADAELDFNPDARLSLIEKYGKLNSKILEVGSGNGRFLQFLRGKGFASVSGEDILISPEGTRLTDQNSELFDMVISYFVLEHILHPNEWLKMLKGKGTDKCIYIFEIPDFENYPQFALNHEHFNFPTRHHVQSMLRKNGFKLLEISNLKSRDFGFMFAFTHADSILPESNTPYPIDQNTITGIFSKYDHFLKKQNSLIAENYQKAIHSGASRIYIWGANEIAFSFLPLIKESDKDRIIFVDRSVQKVGRPFFGTGFTVRNSADVMTEGSYFIISSVSAYDSIHKLLKQRNVEDSMISAKLLDFTT